MVSPLRSSGAMSEIQDVEPLDAARVAEPGIPRRWLMREMSSASTWGSRFAPLSVRMALFSTYSSAPASISFCRFRSESPLSAITGMFAVDRPCFRRVKTSTPFIRGSSKSSKIRSGFCSRAQFSAASPSSAQITSCPALRSARSLLRRRDLLSSTRRIFTGFTSRFLSADCEGSIRRIRFAKNATPRRRQSVVRDR